MKNLVNRLVKEESGQGMVEYGLILALVAVAAMAAFSTLGGKLDSKIDKVNTQLGS